MRRFAMDFAAFVLGAALCALPACAVIHSFARDARPSVKATPQTSFESESQASLRSDRSAHSATKPSKDDSAESFVARSRGVQVFRGGAAWNGHALKADREKPEAGGDRSTLNTRSEREEVHGKRVPIGSGIKPGRHLETLATSAAHLCGVPVAIFHALIQRESSWRPHVVSSAGAVGLAQVKPSTAREVSPTLDVHDPWQNLVAGACILSGHFDRRGSWREALLDYNGGPNRKRTTSAHVAYADGILGGSK